MLFIMISDLLGNNSSHRVGSTRIIFSGRSELISISLGWLKGIMAIVLEDKFILGAIKGI